MLFIRIVLYTCSAQLSFATLRRLERWRGGDSLAWLSLTLRALPIRSHFLAYTPNQASSILTTR